VGGSGTINTVPKFTAATTLGDARITDDATNIILGDAGLGNFRVLGNATSPNIVGGRSANSVSIGVVGATISGGGAPVLGSQGPNRVTDYYGTVGGGWSNRAGDLSGILTTTSLATVGGGGGNIASGAQSTIGGGVINTASGPDATIGGGQGNTASGQGTVVGGGTNNIAAAASGGHATVAGGIGNNAQFQWAAIGGGATNTASAAATVGGGNNNTASGSTSTIPGGAFNTAAGTYSFAAGRRAKANQDGAFVWADSTNADFASTGVNQFLIRAGGGVGIGKSNPAYALDVLGQINASGGLCMAGDCKADWAAVGGAQLDVANTFTAPQTVTTAAGTFALSGTNTAVSGTTFGIKGQIDHTDGAGVQGYATAGTGTTSGVFGRSDSTTGRGVVGYASAEGSLLPSYGVYGESASTGGGYGVFGQSPNVGVRGRSTALSGGNFGVWGMSDSPDGYGVFSSGNAGVTGDLTVSGNVSKGSGAFKIDHPLDPANKYLYHSFVESPDMMNVYNGNAVMDKNGEAWVEMPEWFETLNREFRYQLTALGAPGPNLYIAEEVAGNRFQIAGGKPGMKVSWQVTGVRQDPYAEAHRIKVEQDKPSNERGLYLHPEAYGQPKEKGIQYAHRRPETPASDAGQTTRVATQTAIEGLQTRLGVEVSRAGSGE